MWFAGFLYALIGAEEKKARKIAPEKHEQKWKKHAVKPKRPWKVIDFSLCAFISARQKYWTSRFGFAGLGVEIKFRV